MKTSANPVDNPFDVSRNRKIRATPRQFIGDTLFTVLNYGIFLKKRLFDRTSFSFRGVSYRYFHGWYARTWLTERSVEIPIILRFKREHPGTTLEVGNVLSHYFPVRHAIIDKFEPARGVINGDIETFQSPQPFDLIVSISTLEHVGLHDDVRDPEKVLRCIDHLRSMLTTNGILLFTVPLGINPDMDRYLLGGVIRCAWITYMRRTATCCWEESPPPLAEIPAYGGKWPGAAFLAFACCNR